MRTYKTNTAIAEILIPIAYLHPDKYIQEVSFGPVGRVYITIGSAGRSISVKNIKILACGIIFLNH